MLKSREPFLWPQATTLEESCLQELAARLNPDYGRNVRYDEFQRTYRMDPVAFGHDCIIWREGESLTDYQDEALASLAEKRRVCLCGPHGLGKTATAAVAILWFSLTRDGMDPAFDPDWKCIQTAGVWRQLEKFLWPEVRKFRARLRWDVIGREPFHAKTEAFLLSMRLRTGEAFPVSSDNYDFIEGAHAESMFYVYDESKAIPGATFDASEGAFSGAGRDTGREAFALASSTPGEPSGRFYDIQSRRPGYEDWHVIKVTADDVIKAGRVSAEWVEQRKKQWGVDSPVFRNRVLGEFAKSGDMGVISLAHVEAAVERWHAWNEGKRDGQITAVGVDVGRGGDPSVLAKLVDGVIVSELERVANDETMEIVGRIRMIKAARDGLADVVVDVIGNGAGVVDRCRELGMERVWAFNAGHKTKASDDSGELAFADMRSAMWWWMREELAREDCEICLPPDDELIGELVAPRWRPHSMGRIKVEDKDSLRKPDRLGRSTDKADAVLQALFGADLMKLAAPQEPQVSVGGF